MVLLEIEEILRRRKELQIEVDEQLQNLDRVGKEVDRLSNFVQNADQIMADIEEQFERCTGLNKLDISFLFLATALQIVRQYFITKFPKRLDDQEAAKNVKGHLEEHSDRHHRYYNPSLSEIITNPVPFDANIGANGALSGGGYMGHRVTALGHDPILGLFVGTANIATSTLTNKDLASYHIYTNANNRDFFRSNANTALVFSNTGDKLLHQGIEGKKIIGMSLLKEIIHLKTDLNTKNSLPLPAISVLDANLASELAERGLDMANVVNVGKQAVFSVMINTLIAMIHGLFYDESQYINRRVYEVKTRKIISYSNIMASTSNLIYVGANMALGNEAAIKNLDVGGLLVTIYRVATDARFIRKMKQEFIEKEFFAQLRGTEYEYHF